MQRSTFYGYLILVITVVFLMIFFQKQTRAQSVAFDSIIPFSTTGGMMGFFDRKDGTVYLYEPNLSECLQIVQLKELGLPMKRIK